VSRRPPRLRKFDYVGEHRYFVTCCVAGRRKAFIDRTAVDCVHTQILRTCSDKAFVGLSAVFMPDHLHLLLKGACTSSAFLPFMKLMRQRTAIFYRRLRGDSLWQDGFFDRVLRPDDDTSAVARYMVLNPVRAGLVSKPEEHPFTYGQPSVTGMLTLTKPPERGPEMNPCVEGRLLGDTSQTVVSGQLHRGTH